MLFSSIRPHCQDDLSQITSDNLSHKGNLSVYFSKLVVLMLILIFAAAEVEHQVITKF